MQRYCEQPLQTYLEALASTKSAPGGGSAAALVGAVGVSLLRMVCGLALRKATAEEARRQLTHWTDQLQRSHQRLAALIDEDREAYDALAAAQRRGEAEEIQRALHGACRVPLEICRAVVESSAAAGALHEAVSDGLRADLEAATAMLESAFVGARAMLVANLTEVAEVAARRGIETDLTMLRKRLDTNLHKPARVSG